MKLSRLDTVTANYVNNSTKGDINVQQLNVLQDISTTLAMLYDKLCGDTTDDGINEETFVIKRNELVKWDGVTVYIEFLSPPMGYEAKLVVGKSHDTMAVFEAFDGDITLNALDYNKKWRCWSVQPTDEERVNMKWESKAN